MIQILTLAFTAILGFATAAAATDGSAPTDLIQPAEGRTLDEFLWLKRPVVVFADNPADPRFVQQMQYITDRQDALEDLDVVVLTDTSPADRSAIRQELRPRGFGLVLIAKDGTRIARKPLPWDVREISRAIEKLPLRQQEVRDRRGGLRD